MNFDKIFEENKEKDSGIRIADNWRDYGYASDKFSRASKQPDVICELLDDTNVQCNLSTIRNIFVAKDFPFGAVGRLLEPYSVSMIG